MARVYIFVADGFEEIEGLTVVDLLRRAGIDIVMVSIMGKKSVRGAHNITIEADGIFEDMNFADGDMLVLPGGMPGTTNLMKHQGLDKLLKDFDSKKKPLAAICAAPTILSSKGMLNGKDATCYEGMEAEMSHANIVDAPVVIDGHITTSKGVGTAIDFALSLISTLKDKDEASKIAAQILYKNHR